jgi:hypothetical protein
MSELGQQPENISTPPMHGLLLVGEGLVNMTSERLQTLTQMVGGLGLQIEIVGAADQLPSAETVQPVPATRENFRAFAEQSGYTKARADRAWIHLKFTTSTYARQMSDGEDPFPAIRWLDELTHEIVDLRSVQERLVASHFSPSAWIKAKFGTLNFLGDLINVEIQPDPPLPTDLR